MGSLSQSPKAEQSEQVGPQLDTMEAVHQAGWGGREQLSVRQLARPSPARGCVLVRVNAVSVNAGDHHFLTGRPYLIRCIGRPNIPGMDFSGVIESLGAKVSDGAEAFSVGDEVLGTADTACGAFAEYVCVEETSVVRKPQGVDWEAAATVGTAGETALQALRTGRAVSEGDRVLINGASGGVGTFAVQLAKATGAHVTGVCSTANVELVRSLGADEVVDYRKESLEATEPYDKIIDAVGRPGWRALLNPGGAVVAVALPHPERECVPCSLCEVLCSPWCCCCLSSKKSHLMAQSVNAADMQELAGMLAVGSIRAVVGSRLVGLSELPDALAGHSATLGQGRCVGKTVACIGAVPGEMQRR